MNNSIPKSLTAQMMPFQSSVMNHRYSAAHSRCLISAKDFEFQLEI